MEDVPPDLLDDAAKVAPDYVASLRRERVIHSPDYPKLVREGAVPLYHPDTKRKELYATFAAAVGLEAEWSPTSQFAGLTAREMDLLMAGVMGLKEGGLGWLNKEQRRLLIKAGGLDYFGRQLGY